MQRHGDGRNGPKCKTGVYASREINGQTRNYRNVEHRHSLNELYWRFANLMSIYISLAIDPRHLPTVTNLGN